MRYTSIKEEHMGVRTAVGVFDVSHMGEVMVRGEGALGALQRLVTNDLGRLQDGAAMYTVMCRPGGGIVDDLIVYRLDGSSWMLCVNASNRTKDVAWIREVVGDEAEVVDASDAYAQLAVQGPKAIALMDRLTGGAVSALPSFGCATLDVAGVSSFVARTGYTGEDGVEVYVGPENAGVVFEALMREGRAAGIVLVGLGARDSLRLEARLLLYGNDIDESTNPLEAGLGWVVAWEKGDFVGRDALMRIREHGIERRLRGLVLQGKGMLRAGYAIMVDGEQIGTTTSGSVGFAVGETSIGLGYLRADHADAAEVDVDIRGRAVRATLTRKPFYRRA